MLGGPGPEGPSVVTGPHAREAGELEVVEKDQGDGSEGGRGLGTS